MRYNTIENVVRGASVSTDSYCPSWFPKQAPFLAPEPPRGEVRVLPDNTGPEVTVIKPQKGKGWKQVKRDGDIKMTPYSKQTIEEKHSIYTVRRFVDEYRGHIFMRSGCAYPTDNRVVTPIFKLSTQWDQNYAMSDFSHLPHYGFDSNDLEEQIQDAQNEVLANVVSDQFSGFDLLTEMKELPETLTFILEVLKRARHPLKGMRDLIEAQQKASRRGNTPLGFGAVLTPVDKQFMDKWMEYRYAIMPLIYSIQDALKLFQEKSAEFKTDRSKILIPLHPTYDKPAEDHIFHVIAGAVTVRATAKSSYALPELRLSDLITFNPLATMWETIPYSFVVDWFLNVGAWLTAQTGGIHDLASQRSICVSTKRNILEHHGVIFTVTNGGHLFSDHLHDAGCGNTYHAKYSYDSRTKEPHRAVFYQRRIESYDRVLRQPTDVQLSFSPSMSWKRWIDSFVLSTNLVSNELRKLHLKR